MTALAPAAARSDLFLYMLRTHDHLRSLLGSVLAAMEVNDRNDVHRLWNELDHNLRAYMEAEERFVLPAFAHVDQAEARTLLREHGHIRDELLQLGIAVDLHYVRYARSAEFAQLLEAHAGREENLLYRWADEQLDASAVERVKRHMKTA